jgi:hypothetical protein
VDTHKNNIAKNTHIEYSSIESIYNTYIVWKRRRRGITPIHQRTHSSSAVTIVRTNGRRREHYGSISVRSVGDGEKGRLGYNSSQLKRTAR